MAPGLTVNSMDSRSSGSSYGVASQFSYTKDDDYSSFMSDVLVVGAGPSGLMLAYVTFYACCNTKLIDTATTL